MKLIVIDGKTHTYECFYQGIVVYCVDTKHYYCFEDAARALGITVEELDKLIR